MFFWHLNIIKHRPTDTTWIRLWVTLAHISYKNSTVNGHFSHPPIGVISKCITSTSTYCIKPYDVTRHICSQDVRFYIASDSRHTSGGKFHSGITVLPPQPFKFTSIIYIYNGFRYFVTCLGSKAITVLRGIKPFSIYKIHVYVYILSTIVHIK